MINSLYAEQTRLLLRAIPFVMQEKCFALKGGTAINLFVRDLPRVSVDIDLAFLPDMLRGEALEEIGRALQRIAKRVERNIPETKASLAGKSVSPKVLVDGFGVQIRIEPNSTLRGSVYGQEERELVPAAKAMFETDMAARTMSFADLYAGKLCASLDRQHPRDLFDIKLLLDNEGITDAVRLAFVVYLASHPRPIAELLDPAAQPLQPTFDNHFIGMAREPVTAKDLEKVRDRLAPMIRTSLTQNERKFLMSMKDGQPDWTLLPLPGIERLPALQWKLQNIRRLKENTSKHRKAVDKLAQILKG